MSNNRSTIINSAGYFVAELGETYYADEDYPKYHGEYDVVPTAEEQVLDTRGKILIGDVKVMGTPVERRINPDGSTTVIIGGDVE